MQLFIRIKDFFKRLFSKLRKENTSESSGEQPIYTDDIMADIEIEKAKENLEKFKMHNVIYEKLNYLEQYIKTFSLQYPNEYVNYLNIINKEREDYEQELQEYSSSLLGELTFAIDPECESNRWIAVCKLEDEITNFIESVVNYNTYKEKFAKLCFKLTQFYNALLDTTRNSDVVISQLNNATKSLENLVNQVTKLHFFIKDTRKKEEILNYIIYSEYVFFKTYIRCFKVKNFSEYKANFSKFYELFIDSEYENIMFKFFVEDLEKYQKYITTYLVSDSICSLILNTCQSLQTRLNDYKNVLNDSNFFEELIKFENTVDNISDNNGFEFSFSLPEAFNMYCGVENTLSIKSTAVSVLSMLDTTKAKILCDVLSKFKAEISWRELYFLCRIFELYDDIVEITENTLFGFVRTKFLELNSKYTGYSDTFIKSEKQRLLNYTGNKKKKYIFLLTAESYNLPIILEELRTLCLDFYVCGRTIYLNHSYFNGFKNLEINFGNYKFLEEIQ